MKCPKCQELARLPFQDGDVEENLNTLNVLDRYLKGFPLVNDELGPITKSNPLHRSYESSPSVKIESDGLETQRQVVTAELDELVTAQDVSDYDEIPELLELEIDDEPVLFEANEISDIDSVPDYSLSDFHVAQPMPAVFEAIDIPNVDSVPGYSLSDFHVVPETEFEKESLVSQSVSTVSMNVEDVDAPSPSLQAKASPCSVM